jgi:hypothetical protein
MHHRRPVALENHLLRVLDKTGRIAMDTIDGYDRVLGG